MLGQHPYRVRIIGRFRGSYFVYEDPPGKASSFVHNDGGIIDPSSFWWTDGSMGCDCNRCEYIGEELDCGNEIKIDLIEPIDENWPRLVLAENGDESCFHSISSIVMLGVDEEFFSGITDEVYADTMRMDVAFEDEMRTAFVTVITKDGLVHQCRVCDWSADATQGILFIRGHWSISASFYVR